MLASKEIRLEHRVLFRLDLPNRKPIGVKAKPGKSVRDVFKPILSKYGCKIDNMVVHMVNHAEQLSLSVLLSHDLLRFLGSEKQCWLHMFTGWHGSGNRPGHPGGHVGESASGGAESRRLRRFVEIVLPFPGSDFLSKVSANKSPT